MTAKNHIEELNAVSGYKELEKEITNVFNQTNLSDEEKKDAILNMIKTKCDKADEYKLYSTHGDSNHIRYRTKNGKYSLIIAYDAFHSDMWFFYAANDPNITCSYNSLWEGKRYTSEEQCVKHAELWLSKLMEK